EDESGQSAGPALGSDKVAREVRG
ncbi:MAG: hypothetical protein RLZZ154_581, partial [Actinomycetota bacterium]